MPVVEATGVATAKKAGRNVVEVAMAQAVLDASKEAEAIWARSDLSLAQKQEQIAAVTNPTAIKKRMLDARAKTKAALAAQKE